MKFRAPIKNQQSTWWRYWYNWYKRGKRGKRRKWTWEGVWLIYPIFRRRNETMFNLKFRKWTWPQTSDNPLNFEIMLFVKCKRAMKYILSSHEIKKLKMVTKETDIAIVPFVSIEQYPTSVSTDRCATVIYWATDKATITSSNSSECLQLLSQHIPRSDRTNHVAVWLSLHTEQILNTSEIW